MKKNMLIVGATSGIGKDVYTLLHRTHTLFTLGRTELLGAENHFLCDVLSDPFPAIEAPLHGLVYCPGSIRLKPFRTLRDTDFLEDFNVNVMGAVRTIRQYLKNLQAEGPSSVVLFSTVAVGRGMPFHSSIAAAKGAVEGITRALAAEFAPVIRFNAIAPSLTDTPLAGNLLKNENQREASILRHPMKRLGTPADISNAVSYLLSEQSSWTTGQVLHVDGGLSTL